MADTLATLLNGIEARLDSICSPYGTVSKGLGRYKASALPLIMVSATRVDFEAAHTVISSPQAFYADVLIDVAVIIRDSEPQDWHTDILATMGQVFDSICDDHTLQGYVLDLLPLVFEVGRISITGTEGATQKIYYGGMMQFKARAFYTA